MLSESDSEEAEQSYSSPTSRKLVGTYFRGVAAARKKEGWRRRSQGPCRRCEAAVPHCCLAGRWFGVGGGEESRLGFLVSEGNDGEELRRGL
jgi:hypothetical protein